MQVVRKVIEMEYKIDLSKLSDKEKLNLCQELFDKGEFPFENHQADVDGPNVGRVQGNPETVSILRSEGWDVQLVQ